jgi:hypothetical protein
MRRESALRYLGKRCVRGGSRYPLWWLWPHLSGAFAARNSLRVSPVTRKELLRLWPNRSLQGGAAARRTSTQTLGRWRDIMVFRSALAILVLALSLPALAKSKVEDREIQTALGLWNEFAKMLKG